MRRTSAKSTVLAMCDDRDEFDTIASRAPTTIADCQWAHDGHKRYCALHYSLPTLGNDVQCNAAKSAGIVTERDAYAEAMRGR